LLLASLECYELKFEQKNATIYQAAFEQIKNNHYAEHFALSKKQIQLIGVAFNLRKKGISDHIIRPYHPNS
jgi:hypothetical protein